MLNLKKKHLYKTPKNFSKTNLKPNFESRHRQILPLRKSYFYTNMNDSTNKYFSTFAVKACEPYNMVAMTGGRFNITKSVLLQKLPRILRLQDTISLVFYLSPDTHCILFFDVDHEVDISAVERQLKLHFASTFCIEGS